MTVTTKNLQSLLHEADNEIESLELAIDDFQADGPPQPLQAATIAVRRAPAALDGHAEPARAGLRHCETALAQNRTKQRGTAAEPARPASSAT